MLQIYMNWQIYFDFLWGVNLILSLIAWCQFDRLHKINTWFQDAMRMLHTYQEYSVLVAIMRNKDSSIEPL